MTRKGQAVREVDPRIIPGSMGARGYIVKGEATRTVSASYKRIVKLEFFGHWLQLILDGLMMLQGLWRLYDHQAAIRNPGVAVSPSA